MGHRYNRCIETQKSNYKWNHRQVKPHIYEHPATTYRQENCPRFIIIRESRSKCCNFAESFVKGKS